MHRTDLMGVKIGRSATKTRKLCVIGSPEAAAYKLWKGCDFASVTMLVSGY